MKSIITAILLTLTCNAFAEEEKKPEDMCAMAGDYAESIGTYRDKGLKLMSVLEVAGDSDMIRTITLDAYKRSYLTPVQLSDRWVLKCYEALAK